eukprot:XP_020398216.1 uncharacterized protein LOC109941546 [Zea mays]
MYSGNRKYDSGAEKRKKKQRLEAAAQSQKGALDRFVVRETNGVNIDDDHGDDPDPIQVVDAPNAVDEEIDEGVEAPATDLDETPDANIVDDINTSFQSDIFDPRIWDSLNPKMVDTLLKKGPKRDLSVEHGPRDKLSRRLLAVRYLQFAMTGSIVVNLPLHDIVGLQGNTF